MTAATEPSAVDDRLRQDVLRLADEVHDPCSIGQGAALGLAEMGLVAAVDVRQGAGAGRSVTVRLRLTAPGCLYWMHFERELRSRLLALPEVSEATVVRDLAYDWTPEMMRHSARARLEQRRARLRG